MSKLKKIAKRGNRAARAAVEKAETKFMASRGRKAVKSTIRRAVRVARKATNTGLAVGAVAAALVVRHEMRKRREA